MNHKEKLIEVYNKSQKSTNLINQIPSEYQEYISKIAQGAFKKNKGVYTVLITLLVHKILFPEQDIRYHKVELPGGFSGRTVDTQYITPTLRELCLPAMAESGWLTRSLEQSFPYSLDYRGKITPSEVKKAFLSIIDYVENDYKQAEIFLQLLFNKLREQIKSNQIQIIQIDGDKLNIDKIIQGLNEHFQYKYKTPGGSKLPVIAFYAIYQLLIQEIDRYKFCELKKLDKHTASDLTSRKAGDIEIFDKDQKLLEVIEIKYEREINVDLIRIVRDKIIKYNPTRYYIFSSKDIKSSDKIEIDDLIKQVAQEHGCQIIVNGIIPTIKYYLRLIKFLDTFIENYSILIQSDEELQAVHKEKWNDILLKVNERG